MKKTISWVKKILYGSLSLILFFALWEIAVVAGWVPEAVVPTPITVFLTLISSFSSGLLISQMLISIVNVLIGFLISIIIAIPVGLLVGSFYGKVENLLMPFFRMCEKLNPFALFPVFMIFFGIGSAEKIAVVFWVSQWPLLYYTIDSIRNMDSLMIKSARSMNADFKTMLFKVILPAAVPGIFSGLKMSAQLAFFMIIASEMIGSSDGLGWLYLSAGNAYNVPLMYAIIIFITVMSIIINVVFTKLEKHFLVWKQSGFEPN